MNNNKKQEAGQTPARTAEPTSCMTEALDERQVGVPVPTTEPEPNLAVALEETAARANALARQIKTAAGARQAIDIVELMRQEAQIINQALDLVIPDENCYPSTIYQAMRYSLLAGGKRLRPALMLWAAQAVGGEPGKVLPAACGLEMIHTYSLIHDDLPALDNDNYRRGRLTCHKAFDEATAILTGDALLTEAFRVIAANAAVPGIDAAELIQVLGEIAALAGTEGMVGGQMVDIAMADRQVDEATMRYMHSHKTGALIKAAVRTGARLQGADQQQLVQLTRYAEQFGLAFQITDDILDVTGDAVLLGKETGSDSKNNKATYPALYGLERSGELAQEAVAEAIAALSEFSAAAEPLRQLAGWLVLRQN